jgi:hypothetical protein
MQNQGSNRPAPSEAAREVMEVGSTVLRGVWDPAHLAKLREAIAVYSEMRKQYLSRGDVGPSERMYVAHGVGTFTGLVRAKLIEPDILREMFVGSYFHELCREYYQDDQFYVAMERLGFRIHDPNVSSRSFIPYHQDSYTQDVRTPRILNCWMTLDPGAGSDAPGLEVVRDLCRPDFPRKDFGLRSENAAYDFITIDRDEIVKEYGENFLAPEFDVGDGLVFSENVIHRTYVTPTMTKPRTNFELRVFSPKHIAEGVLFGELAMQSYRLA